MKRILTAVVGVPLVVAAVLALPPAGLMVLAVALTQIAILEYVRLARRAGADRVVGLLLVLVPAAAIYLTLDLWGLAGAPRPDLLVVAMIASGVIAVAALASRGDFKAALGAIGAVSFGLPYFTLALVSYGRLQELSPWFLVLMLAITWGGDSAAFFVGTRWGRRKLAPVVSPNKTWLGAAASFVAALAITALWCQLRYQRVEPAILAAAAAAAVAAQLGDLVESLFKRGVGVKDSGNLLPGHGGMLDRMDAGLLAAPTLYLALRALGVGS